MKFLVFIVMANLLCSCSPSKEDYTEPAKPPVENPDTGDDDVPSDTSIKMKLTIANTAFTATLTPSAAVSAFKAMLPLTLTMSDYNNNEKVTSLPSSLPTEAINPATIQTGDIMLYGSSSLVLFYETFPTPYSYTRIGKIDNITGLKAALGTGSVTIKFELNGD